MKICNNCRTENEDRFIYCKNCGTQLQVLRNNTSYSAMSGVHNVNSAPVPAGLVPVTMMLPSPEFPDYRTAQTVYVTPAQKAAIEYSLKKQTPVAPVQQTVSSVAESENE